MRVSVCLSACVCAYVCMFLSVSLSQADDNQKKADRLYELKMRELDQRACELQHAEEECRRAINEATKNYNRAQVLISIIGISYYHFSVLSCCCLGDRKRIRSINSPASTVPKSSTCPNYGEIESINYFYFLCYYCCIESYWYHLPKFINSVPYALFLTFSHCFLQ